MGKGLAATVPRIQQLCTLLLREPKPGKRQIAEQITSVLRSSEESCHVSLVEDAQGMVRTHGLLASDAMILGLVRRHGIAHLATNDDDFDRLPGLTIWKPR